MNTIKNFDEMVRHLSTGNRRITIAVACGYDESTLCAVEQALASGFARVIFVGDPTIPAARPTLASLGALIEYARPGSDDPAATAALSVSLVREGRADILMKGLIPTDILLRAVLNKATGLLPAGAVLTHLAVAQSTKLGRLLFFTDAAVIPYPTPEQRAVQLGYAITTCRRFGIERPRVALIHCSEHVSDKFPHTLTYADLSRRAAEGEWGEAIVDGPLDVRTSIDPVALHTKGIESPIEGRADALIFPDIEAGNAFYKTTTFLAGMDVAGTLCGTSHPVILPSRGDSADDKFYSLAFAAIQRTGH